MHTYVYSFVQGGIETVHMYTLLFSEGTEAVHMYTLLFSEELKYPGRYITTIYAYKCLPR